MQGVPDHDQGLDQHPERDGALDGVHDPVANRYTALVLQTASVARAAGRPSLRPFSAGPGPGGLIGLSVDEVAELRGLPRAHRSSHRRLADPAGPQPASGSSSATATATARFTAAFDAHLAGATDIDHDRTRSPDVPARGSRSGWACRPAAIRCCAWSATSQTRRRGSGLPRAHGYVDAVPAEVVERLQHSRAILPAAPRRRSAGAPGPSIAVGTFCRAGHGPGHGCRSLHPDLPPGAPASTGSTGLPL